MLAGVGVLAEFDAHASHVFIGRRAKLERLTDDRIDRDALVGFEPGHESEARDWAFCLAQLARKSGQRALDLDDARRQAVLAVLRTLPIPEAWPTMVEEVVAAEGAERSQLFGESLPIGLRLK